MDEQINKREVGSKRSFFKDTKNRLYQKIMVAGNAKTGEKMLVYQALFGEYEIFVRPLSDFEKKNESQKSVQVKQEDKKQEISQIYEQTEKKVLQKQEDISEQIHPDLLKFLEAETFEEKLNILVSMKKDLNSTLLNNMAAATDIVVNEGSLEEQYESLRTALKTQMKFEVKFRV